ncbi:MAG TPA: anti-sigma factor antagonist [Phycisphaerales bacterium]|nr:anti-sigma factor antagonist [Phycisphaerales bacterium]
MKWQHLFQEKVVKNMKNISPPQPQHGQFGGNGRSRHILDGFPPAYYHNGVVRYVQENAMSELKPRIRVEYTKNATIITFTDEKILEERDVRALQEAVMHVVEQSGPINLILDFYNVRFLSSAVLGLLLRVSKRVYEAGGQLRLCNINPKIYEIFKITRLTRVFDIYRDALSALEGLE